MSRVSVIALGVFILIMVWIFTWGDESVLRVKRAALTMSSPFVKVRDQISETVETVSKPQLTREQLLEANERLLEEVRQLRIENQALERLYEENAKLRQALVLREVPNFELVAAEVISRKTSTWYHTLEIDKGTEHGLKDNDPVMVDTGLVGKIDLASAKTSRVLLLTDEACKVTARVIGTNQSGILEGQGNRTTTEEVLVGQGEVLGRRGGINNQPTLRLRYLDKTARIQPGMNVISSGQGLVFPPNLDLGTVKSVHPGDITTEAEVEPYVDFSSLDFVFVITGTK